MARSLSAQPNLTLDEYRVLLNIPICVFNGVENPNESVSGCDLVWNQWERDQLAQALRQAEDTLAGQLGFTLGEEYQVSEVEPWTEPMQLRWGHIVGGGVQGIEEVIPVASDFTIDPATITVAQADFPDGGNEIYISIVEDSTGLEIVPDKVESVGANYIIYIDQCKLIEWDDLEYQKDPITYDAAFPDTIWLKLGDLTINRQYLDGSEQAVITYGPACNCACAGVACAGASYDGCVYVIDAEISKVRIQMATYDATTEAWTCGVPVLTCGCYEGDKVCVMYQAGTTAIPGYEQAIMRLAHTYMAVKPCACSMFDYLWHRDTDVPSVLTAERVNNPFGTANGAWFSWQWAETHKHGRAFML